MGDASSVPKTYCFVCRTRLWHVKMLESVWPRLIGLSPITQSILIYTFFISFTSMSLHLSVERNSFEVLEDLEALIHTLDHNGVTSLRQQIPEAFPRLVVTSEIFLLGGVLPPQIR